MILDGVEKGKYLVQQKQGSTGRSTTGIMSQRGGGTASRGGDRPRGDSAASNEESGEW